jgi:hypothetical protein
MKRLLVLFGILLATVVSAANFTTERYDVAATVARDRSLEVTETIAVTFTKPQRGLIRKIPFRTKGRNGASRDVQPTFLGAEIDTGGGFGDVPVQPGFEGGDWRLRIGDPNRTISGPATFRVRYRLDGMLTDFTDGKNGNRIELFWNAIGTGWSTRIDKASLRIEFPPVGEGFFLARVLMGGIGSRAGIQFQPGKPDVGRSDLLKGSLTRDAGLRVETMVPLEKGQGLTVVMGVPEGTVEEQGLVNPQVDTTPNQPGYGEYPRRGPPVVQAPAFQPIGLAIPFFALPFLYFGARRYFAPKQGPLVVRFDPPQGVGPSECGVVLDDRIDPSDVIAGIVSLAQKGALRMIHSGTTAATVSVELLGLHQARGVTPFESMLFESLSRFGTYITPETLRGQFGNEYAGLTQALSASVYQHGYYTSNVETKRGCLSFAFYAALFVLVFLSFPFVGCTAVLGAFAAALVAKGILSKISNLTPLGAKVRGEVLGLREFITRANQKEFNYMANRMPDQAMFEQLLPYAVAFGAVKQWTDAFSGLDIAPPEWFYGYNAYGATDMLWTFLLVDSLTNFGNVYSDAMTYHDPPSGPFSDFGTGGGFSSGDSGFGSSDGSGGFDFGGFDSGSGGFDGGGSVGDGGGGGGGDSW